MAAPTLANKYFDMGMREEYNETLRHFEQAVKITNQKMRAALMEKTEEVNDNNLFKLMGEAIAAWEAKNNRDE